MLLLSRTVRQAVSRRRRLAASVQYNYRWHKAVPLQQRRLASTLAETAMEEEAPASMFAETATEEEAPKTLQGTPLSSARFHFMLCSTCRLSVVQDGFISPLQTKDE